MAVKIGKALGVDPQTWLKLQMDFDLDSVDFDEVDVDEIAA
jgi:plasmid maintenance system antidote protein VapI